MSNPTIEKLAEAILPTLNDQLWEASENPSWKAADAAIAIARVAIEMLAPQGVSYSDARSAFKEHRRAWGRNEISDGKLVELIVDAATSGPQGGHEAGIERAAKAYAGTLYEHTRLGKGNDWAARAIVAAYRGK